MDGSRNEQDTTTSHSTTATSGTPLQVEPIASARPSSTKRRGSRADNMDDQVHHTKRLGSKPSSNGDLRDDNVRGSYRVSTSTIGKGTGPSSEAGYARHARRRSHLSGPVISHPLFAAVLVIVIGAALWNWQPNKPSLAELSTSEQVKELEQFSKKTTKWMQVQLEIVDMKLGQEIEVLRKEMNEKLEDHALQIETNVKNLKVEVDDLGKSVQSLFNEGFLTRREGMELVQSVIAKRAAESKGNALSLDEVRVAARQIVEEELTKHSADGVGRADYALGTAGAKVMHHSPGYFATYESAVPWAQRLGKGLWGGSFIRHPMAHVVLEPSFGEPGRCLPLAGSDVFIDIGLRTAIYPEAITLEHVHESVAYDLRSAPKEFLVFGWFDKGLVDRTGLTHPETKILLGEFTYEIDKPNNVRTYDLPEEAKRELINMVRLHVVSNYGSPTHTCIYRFRIHGSEQTKVIPALP